MRAWIGWRSGSSVGFGDGQAIPLRAILIAAAVGTALRCWNLPNQVLVGDELHVVRAALGSDLATILTSYRQSDPCLPLAGLFRLAVVAGIPLSELLLRLPVLLTGVATLIALPILLGRLAPAARPVLAWLLALSPSLILYSRIVRPYAPIVLWSGIAAGCFWVVWNRCRQGAAPDRGRVRLAVAGFLVSATLDVWFHLGTAPLIAALFGFAVLDLAIDRPADWRRPLARLIALGAALGICLALPLLPAAESLRVLAATKRVAQEVPAATYATVLRLQAGTASTIAAGLFWLAALCGLARVVRADARAALFTAVVVGGQVAGIRLLSPQALEIPIAFHRYVLPVLPFVLLWVAVALSPPWPKCWGAGAARFALPLQAVLLAGLILAGPFSDRETWRTSFLHDVPYVDFSQGGPQPDARLTAQLEGLAAASGRGGRGGSRPVIAAAWPPNRYGSRVFALAQEVHGRHVLVVSPGLAGSPQVAFRNFVSTDPQALLATDAQFLILHTLGATDASTAVHWPRLLRRQWGKPAWTDDSIQVWDLDAVRARSGRRANRG